jgi:hypothetical protein
MRRRIFYNGLIPGQTVDAHIKEAAYRQTQKGEYEYQKYFHGCLLWTYHRQEVNTWWTLLPGVASSVIVRHFFCRCKSGFIGTKQSWQKIELPPF